MSVRARVCVHVCGGVSVVFVWYVRAGYGRIDAVLCVFIVYGLTLNKLQHKLFHLY